MRYVLALFAAAALAVSLCASTPVDAQNVALPFGAPAQGGLTISARGVVGVPADSLRFQLFLHANSGASLDDAGKTVAQTLRANGVTDATWALPLEGYITQGSMPAVVGTIAKPTREKLEGILRAAAVALPAAVAGAVSPQGTSVSWTLRVDDCGPALDRATKSALEQARRQAEQLARESGVTLGRITGIARTEQSSNGCATKPDAEPEFNGPRRSDAYGKQDVIVAVGITVTYAIR